MPDIANTSQDIEGYYRSMWQRSPKPTIAAEWLADRVCYVNPAFCTLVGKDKNDILGRPVMDAIPEGWEKVGNALLRRVRESGNTETLEEQEPSPSSLLSASPVVWSFSAWVVLDRGDEPLGVIMQVADVTEIAVFRRKMTAINQDLLVSGVHQHELTQKAEDLGVRLVGDILEIHGHVKNHIQVFVALAEIQIMSNTSPVSASTIQRISTHTHTHDDLYKLLTHPLMGNVKEETLDVHVSLGKLLPILQTKVGTRNLHFDIATVRLSFYKSACLSLLISELVGNAFQHGTGDIVVTLTQDGEEACLTVSDQGKGFPEQFDYRNVGHVGMELISTIATYSLRGGIQFGNKPEGGACIRVEFPLWAGYSA